MKTPHIFLLALITVFSAACGQSTSQDANDKSSSSEIVTESKLLSAAEFKEKMKLAGVQIIDVRTDEEVAEGMIPGATQMNIMDRIQFKEGVETLDPDKPVLVYCKGGGRSAQASEYLEEKGFKEVYDLNGGFMNWVANEGTIQISE